VPSKLFYRERSLWSGGVLVASGASRGHRDGEPHLHVAGTNQQSHVSVTTTILFSRHGASSSSARDHRCQPGIAVGARAGAGISYVQRSVNEQQVETGIPIPLLIYMGMDKIIEWVGVNSGFGYS